MNASTEIATVHGPAETQRRLQNMMDGLVRIGICADDSCDGGEHHHRSRDSSVFADALPNIVTLETLALSFVEQLLAGL